ILSLASSQSASTTQNEQTAARQSNISQQPASVGAIQGTVIRWGTSEGIAGAQVTLTPMEANPTASGALGGARGARPASSTVTTDTDGNFEFKNLPIGQYSLQAQRDGYFGLSSRSPAPTSVMDFARVVAGESATVTPMPLMKGSMVNGRISDAN